MKAFSNRKRSRMGWAIMMASLLYILLAQRSLVQTQTITLIGAQPVVEGSAATSPFQAAPIFGFPYTENSRFFILRPDQQGLTEIKKDGSFLWSIEFGTPITADSISASLSAWGLLDGSIKILDEVGRIIAALNPSSEVASKYGCVYGIAVSSNGAIVAALYGIDPQYFLIYAKNGDGYRLVSSRKLDKQVRNAQELAFSTDGEFAIGRTADGLAVYDVAKKQSKIVHPADFAGEAELQVKPIGKDGFVFLLAKGDKRFSGLIRKGALEALFPVDGAVASIRIEESGFLLASGNWAYRYKVSAR
ncbi:MAG: hypothetical protein ACYC1A_09610 [Spirochaetales bacterium]